MRRRKPNKYKAVKECVDGITFDSGREAKRYRELKMLKAAGQIISLEIKPRFYLHINGRAIKIRSKGYPNGRRTSYTADFRYLDTHTNETVVEDTKGYDTAASRFRRAVVEAQYGIEITLI